MPLTDHQAKYLAHELTRRWSSDSMGKLAAAVAGAQVDLNPHQVDAALFAFNSPFSNGAILADEAHLYRLGHPLADAVVSNAKTRPLPPAEIEFSYAELQGKVSTLEPWIGQSGWLRASLFSVDSLDQTEDYLILAAHTDDGRPLDQETAGRLLTLPGRLFREIPADAPASLDEQTEREQACIRRDISERNARFFEEEADKLDRWSDDLKLTLEQEIKDIDRQIKEARRAASIALSLEEKLNRQKQIKELERHRKERRRSLFDAQDEIDHNRERLIERIEGKLKSESSKEQLFTIRWTLL